MHNLEVLIPISLFFAVAFIIKISIEHKTMRLLINRGENIENLKEILENLASKPQIAGSMKWGMILIGIGASFILARLFPPGMHEEMTVSFMFLLAGFALIIYYFLGSKENNK